MSEVEALVEQAFAAYEARRWDEARRLFEQCLESLPDDAGLWNSYAIVLDQLDRRQEAIRAAEHALSSEEDWHRGFACNIIGKARHQLKQYVAAEHWLRQSLALDPQSFTWVFLYEVCLDTNRDDEAIECLREALKLDPNYDEAHFLLGQCHKLRKQFGRAEQHLRRAVEIDPEYARAYAELGSVLWKRALQSQRLAVQNDSDLKESWQLSQEAQQTLTKAVELDPADVWARVYLANVLNNTGKIKAAESHYQAALELEPDWSMTHWCYGDYLSRNDIDHARAGQLLKRAVGLAPEDGTAHFYLGKHYFRCHRKYKATQALQEAVRLGDAGAARFLKRIDAG